ncbi:AraC-like ligand binding domain protein [Paenibacillus sp. oral taxon 786 str. D14]|uniref:AraC family transcriptional regulator n=1 Tax=Paenibacillus sp. oral taxon 786 TaxID=652715 RepID=UPI0001AFD09C|nr:AraC family transcriptional regulator [Paenibacillus sp. oral taxon 786]EES75295.1 AraC-like ligand binding domain protein [Paenibacillus sp. oral taxon 786 str. D14]
MGAIFHYNPDRPFRESPDLYLCYWGKERCAPLHSFGPGVRDIYKIHFIHSGRGIVKVEGETFELTGGQAFLAYPERVIFYQADEVDPWTYSWIGFNGEQVAEILSRTRLTPASPVLPMDTHLMPQLYELLNEAEESNTTRDLRLQTLLYEFMTLLVELVPASGDADSTRTQAKDAYIHRCLDFLHSHYSEEMSVGQLAAIVGLDRKYLSSLFKRATGMPPQQYLLKYRMEKACALLRNGHYSIAEVARSVGYQDALLFSKMFKKTVGTSPSDYREQWQKSDIMP